MDRKELGQLIKEARLAKKMTQSEVVGNFITRNMLSQIESGTAIPSVKTLQYLSERLDISIQMLSADDQAKKENVDRAGGDYTLYRIMQGAKERIRANDPVAALNELLPYLSEPNVYEDEFAALYSISCLEAARLKTVSPEDALRYAEEAMLYAGQGIYESHERKTEAMLLAERLRK